MHGPSCVRMRCAVWQHKRGARPTQATRLQNCCGVKAARVRGCSACRGTGHHLRLPPPGNGAGGKKSNRIINISRIREKQSNSITGSRGCARALGRGGQPTPPTTMGSRWQAPPLPGFLFSLAGGGRQWGGGGGLAGPAPPGGGGSAPAAWRRPRRWCRWRGRRTAGRAARRAGRGPPAALRPAARQPGTRWVAADCREVVGHPPPPWPVGPGPN